MKKLICRIGIISCLIVFGGGVVGTLNNAQADSHSIDRGAVERIIQDYIEKNPELIVNALNNYQRLEQEKREKQAENALKNNKDYLFNDPRSPVAGNPKGDVTVVEFFDYNCGFCKRSAKDVNKILESDPNVRFVFKEFPILSPESEIASKMALAADKQGKYLEFHNALMEAAGRLSQDRMESIAQSLGLNVDRLKADMDLSEIQEIIDENRNKAVALGIQGTPGFIIEDVFLRGAVGYEKMQQTIDNLRKNR